MSIALSLYSLSNKMNNFLLVVRDINHKYIVVDNMSLRIYMWIKRGKGIMELNDHIFDYKNTYVNDKNYYIGNYYISDGIKPMRLKVRMPIEWIKLSEDADEILLLSKDCLDWEQYDFDDVIKEVTWNESYLKNKLDELFDSFFSKEESEVIIEKTMGKLFPLSEEEIRFYIPREENRCSDMFFSEDSNGEIIIRKEKFGYWLRKDCYSVTEYGIEIPYVNRRGKIMYGDGTMDEIGIRIAMYVNKKKVENLKF